MWSDVTKSVIEKLNGENVMSENDFFAAEIALWKGNGKRRSMIDGERYFKGDHDILKSERLAIGRDGRLKRVENLPNNRIVDNQYQRMVNQKVNYLLGRDILIEGSNEEYVKVLTENLGRDFQRMLKCLLRDAVNMGIGWLYLYTDEKGRLKFKRIPAYEMIAYWKDDEHTELDRCVRVYTVEGYKGTKECAREIVEIYGENGVEIFETEEGKLKKCGESEYFNAEGIPLVAFKYNEKEIPLIDRVKPLQDALNKTLSDFENNLEEDARNTILVLQNYDGTDLGEFRQNLALYGAVKVKSVDGTPGDIKTLNTQFDSENYSVMVNLLKSAIVENAMGYDAKGDKLGNNPNQLVMKAMFSDIDLDMSEAEIEFRFSFFKLCELVKEYMEIYSVGYFENEHADIVFNRDCLVNESEAIDNCIKSDGVLSEETVLLMHPWVKDVKKEKERKEKENG